MLKAPTDFIIVFIIISVLLILALAVFISIIIYRYQQKQNTYFKEIEILKSSHENALLQSQLEIQEQTLQNISRELHDNIGQKLTLAKLHLNTLAFDDIDSVAAQVIDSVSIISDAINELSDLSHSMSSEIILNNGIIKALEYEKLQLEKSGLFTIYLETTGDPVYLDGNTELVLFRIVQEALNNIVKHASATVIQIHMHYDNTNLSIEVNDNGRGFNTANPVNGAGLLNVKKRTAMLGGELKISSYKSKGTAIIIKIPLNIYETDT